MILRILALAAVVLCSCSTLTAPTPAQTSAVIGTAQSIADVAVPAVAGAVASAYGGPAAGVLATDVMSALQPVIDRQASAGLNAAAATAQAYVGQKIPPAILVAAPGVPGVGAALLTGTNGQPVVNTSQPVNQADVNLLYQAAALALKKK